MERIEHRTYRIREFARLAGVTVRALHHYDRVGLLKPTRTERGYRVYSTSDLERLEQIVALKFIGLPLKRIRALLRTSRSEFTLALRAQRSILQQKHELLQRAIDALGNAEAVLREDRADPSAVLRQVIEVIEMQNKSEEWKQQYDELLHRKMERLKGMSPEERAQLQKRWKGLLADVEAALDEEPSSLKAQALGERWMTILESFGGGVDPTVAKALGAAYQTGPDGRTPVGNTRVWDFMRRVLAART